MLVDRHAANAQQIAFDVRRPGAFAQSSFGIMPHQFAGPAIVGVQVAPRIHRIDPFAVRGRTGMVAPIETARIERAHERRFPKHLSGRGGKGRHAAVPVDEHAPVGHYSGPVAITSNVGLPANDRRPVLQPIVRRRAHRGVQAVRTAVLTPAFRLNLLDGDHHVVRIRRAAAIINGERHGIRADLQGNDPSGIRRHRLTRSGPRPSAPQRIAVRIARMLRGHIQNKRCIPCRNPFGPVGARIHNRRTVWPRIMHKDP